MIHFNKSSLLSIPVIIILLMHSIPGIFNNGINDFGKLYLDQIGFSPIGLGLAWMIKLSHIACALALLFNRYVKPMIIITMLILITGIFMVHLKDGWYVVGGGRNGIEFNFLLLFVLAYLGWGNAKN
jgi:putative oxidoreductase